MRTLLPLVLVLLLLPRAAFADGAAPLVPVPPGDDVVTYVAKGAPAPYTGQLFDSATALRWANYLQQAHFRLDADVAYQKKYDEASMELLTKELALEKTQYATVTTDLQTRLTASQKELAEGPPWYKSLGFGVVLGVVGTIAAVAAAAAVTR